MKTILTITALFLLTSCSVFRKTKQTSVHQSEQTEVVKQDSLVISKKDSSYTSREQSENMNTVEIELSDSATGETDTVRIPINGNEYFSFPIRQKVKKVTVKSSQTANIIQGGQIKTEEVKQGSRKEEKKLTKTDKSEVVKTSRCGFPLWWAIAIIVLGAILLRVYTLFIAPLAGVINATRK